MGHVDGIRIIKAGCQIRNPAGGCRVAINSTNGNGTGRRFPGCRGVCGGFIGDCRNRVIAFSIFFISCCRYRTVADSYTAVNADIRIMADDYSIGSSQFFIFIICRTNDYIVALTAQLVVITKDNVIVATVQSILSTNNIIALTVRNSVVETIYIVQFRIRNRVAHTDDLSLVGTSNLVATADGHDLSTTVRNGLLQSVFQFFRRVSLHLAGVNRYISVRIRDGVPGAQDDGGVGIGGYVALADDAVGHATESLTCIGVLVQVQGAQGNRGCTTQIDAGSRSRIHDPRIGAYHRRADAGRTGFIARSQTSKSRSTVILFIGDEAVDLGSFVDRVIFGLGITDGSLHLPYRSGIRISGTVFQSGDLMGADVHIAAADGGTISTQCNRGT